MYKIYLSDSLVFDDEDIREDRFVEEPILELEAGKAGTLKFSVYPNHSLYNSFYKLTSYIRLIKDNNVIFKGRVLSSEDNMIGARKITVEGSMAFLNDSVIRPYDFSVYTYQRKTPAELLSWYLSQHNSQVETTRQLTLGTVTVTLAEGQYLTPSTRSYDSTMSNISKQLIDECGGFLLTRYENGVTYLDYLADFTVVSNQTVEFGKNLMDITQTIRGDELATAIIPLGNDEEVEEEYVDPDTGVISTHTVRRPITIVGVIDPDTHEEVTVDYLRNETLITQYGLIFKSVEFDVDLRIDLYNKAKAYVNGLAMLARTIELNALDLSKINTSLDAFSVGTKVHVKSSYHGVDNYIPVTKISVNILHPEDSQLTLGNILSYFTESNTREKNTTNKVIDKMKGLTDNELIKLASTPMLKLSWNSVTNVAKMEQTDKDRLVQYPVTGGKIYIDCNDYPTMHNYKIITNTPSNKCVFFALYPVIEGSEIIYHPFFAMQVISNSEIKWYDVNDISFTTEVTNIFIVGILDLKNDITQLWGVGYTPSEANTNIFMNYLATVGDVSDDFFQTYANATGISNVFGKIAIIEAFVRRLHAVNLDVGANGNFKVLAQTYDAMGEYNPIFKIVYGANELFKVDALTGKVYIGVGLKYDPEDSATEITLAKLHDVIIDGDSEFSGVFKTASIQTMKGNESSINVTVVDYSVEGIVSGLVSAGLMQTPANGVASTFKGKFLTGWGAYSAAKTLIVSYYKNRYGWHSHSFGSGASPGIDFDCQAYLMDENGTILAKSSTTGHYCGNDDYNSVKDIIGINPGTKTFKINTSGDILIVDVPQGQNACTHTNQVYVDGSGYLKVNK